MKTLRSINLDHLNNITCKYMTGHIGIAFTELGKDFLCAEMPVDNRTKQAMGFLHGGASVVLAETIGSVGGLLCLPEDKYCMGLSINASHIGSIREGYVIGKGTPLHVGKSTQVWEITIKEKNTNRLICVSRLTLAVLNKKNITLLDL